VGAAFIVAGVLVSELKLKRKKNALPEDDSATLNHES